MYWRIRNVTPDYFLRLYGVHVALVISLLMNGILFITRPSKPGVSAAVKSDFDAFARHVTVELWDLSWISYEQSISALLQNGQLAPSVIAQMQKTDKLPKSVEEIKAIVRTLADTRQVSAIRIDNVQQQDPDEKGLIPVSVSGVVVVHSADESKSSDPTRFHFLYKMGMNAQTQKPIVAAFSED